jgi:AraC-like DNA-binding protein
MPAKEEAIIFISGNELKLLFWKFEESMQHVEFFHKDHFAYRYYRKKPTRSLAQYIDFFWETDFESLWPLYPDGFSDALFPNIGYTYLINLGTPFVMQLENESYEVKGDGFLPRHKNMICHHSLGNKIFGIKFKVSPIIFEKKINFHEYREYIFPLAYLIDRSLINSVKESNGFEKRIELITSYYNRIIEKHFGSAKYVDVVTQILDECNRTNNFSVSIDSLAKKYNISTRTLQRYFEATTSITSKQALQILRIRKAVEHLVNTPETFHFTDYGYYDYSHFYKHLKSFINRHTISIIQPHLQLLHGGLVVNENSR